MRKRVHHGFTLIEMLIVIIVIAVLAAVVVPKVVNVVSTSRTNTSSVNLKILNDAIARVQADAGSCPADGTKAVSWLTSTTKPSDWPSGASWNGPYVESVPNNPATGAAYSFTASTCKFS